MRRRHVFADVWDAIEDNPAERDRLRMRSELLGALERRVIGWKVTRSEAARRLGITQPRLNGLLRGRLDKFSLGASLDLATRAGIGIKLTIDDKASGPAGRQSPSLDTISDLIGSVDGLPSDLGARTKHYLRVTGYGRKRPR